MKVSSSWGYHGGVMLLKRYGLVPLINELDILTINSGRDDASHGQPLTAIGVMNKYRQNPIRNPYLSDFSCRLHTKDRISGIDMAALLQVMETSCTGSMCTERILSFLSLDYGSGIQYFIQWPAAQPLDTMGIPTFILVILSHHLLSPNITSPSAS